MNFCGSGSNVQAAVTVVVYLESRKGETTASATDTRGAGSDWFGRSHRGVEGQTSPLDTWTGSPPLMMSWSCDSDSASIAPLA